MLLFLTEPVELQKFKVVAPTDPDRVVTIIGNASPSDKVQLTPADILAEMSYFLNLAEDIGRVVVSTAEPTGFVAVGESRQPVRLSFTGENVRERDVCTR